MEIYRRIPGEEAHTGKKKNRWQRKTCYVEYHLYCYENNSFSSIYEMKFNEINVWIYILFKQNTGMTVWQIVLQLHAALISKPLWIY